MISNGKKVRIAYNLSVDGKLVECVSSHKPFHFVQGEKGPCRGLQSGLKGLMAGDKKTFWVQPKDAYGASSAHAVIECPKARYPKRDHVIGRQIRSAKDGKYLATVKAVKTETLVLDFNHPYAGKAL